MVRIAFLAESLLIVFGLPWCACCVLSWSGCQERALTPKEVSQYQALQSRIRDKMARIESTRGSNKPEVTAASASRSIR